MREWSISTSNVTVITNAVNTLAWVFPGAIAGAGTPNIEFLRHWMGQYANATSAQVSIAFSAMSSQQTYTTNTVAVTPARLKVQDNATCSVAGSTTMAAGKCGVVSSAATEQTAGTGSEYFLWRDAFNVLNGFLKVNTPAETEVFQAGVTTYSRLQLPTGCGASATSTGWNLGQCFREV